LNKRQKSRIRLSGASPPQIELTPFNCLLRQAIFLSNSNNALPDIFLQPKSLRYFSSDNIAFPFLAKEPNG